MKVDSYFASVPKPGPRFILRRRSFMKIAAIHYHLDRGGVTQVMLNQTAGLNSVAGDEVEKLMLMHGGRCGGLPQEFNCRFPCEAIAIAGLEYDERRGAGDPSTDEGLALAKSIAKSIHRCGGSAEDTVLHIHNHSLGKNASMASAMRMLAADGWPILLQIHDFAEDYRPTNYRLLIEATAATEPAELETLLYPQGSRIQYAALTRRDYALLQSVGIDDSDIHRLPNSITLNRNSLPKQDSSRAKLAREVKIAGGEMPASHRLGVYPVRGIRRKNVGEMLLWAAVCEDVTLAVTLPPSTLAERKSYDRWKRVSQQLQLPVVFDVGTFESMAFPEVLASADFVFTSSVAEGFGMVFLEALLAGQPLLGRDLPGVTADFCEAGLQYHGLAPQLLVPRDGLGDVDSIRREAFAETWRTLPQAFRRFVGSNHAMCGQSESIDFAMLTPELQRQVIVRAAEDAGYAQAIASANRVMQIADFSQHDAVAASNCDIVQTAFAPELLANRLLDIFRGLLNREPPETEPRVAPPASPGNLFAQLASLKSFAPCRVESL